MTCQPSTSSAEDSPASPSVSPGRNSAPPTSDGSGPTSPAPFAYYDPDTRSWKTSQASLFTEWETYSGPWPRSGTLRSGAAYPQPPWVRLISAGASSYWPTPTARLGDERGPQAKRYWDPRRSNDLDDAVAVMVKGIERGLWPTPTQADGTGGPGTAGRDGGVNLRTAVTLWPTSPVEGNRNRASYPGKSGDGLQTAVGGSLNPDWVEWLMGFPIGWTDLER